MLVKMYYQFYFSVRCLHVLIITYVLLDNNTIIYIDIMHVNILMILWERL